MHQNHDPHEALRAEIDSLRASLWQCYLLAGGDAQLDGPGDLDNQQLAALTLDCVRDLRGFFDAARRDLRCPARPTD
jgi:hypothetical protein